MKLVPKQPEEPSKPIVEEEEEPSANKHPVTKSPIRQKSPLKAASHAKQQSVAPGQSDNLMDAALSQAFGQGAEVKRLETELRKKKEEVYSLQIEVKEMGERLVDKDREKEDKAQ